MRRALALAVLLAAAPAARAQWDEDEDRYGEDRSRLSLTAWAGEAFAAGGAASGVSDGPHLGGEVAWQFDPIELGVQGASYRLRAAPGHDWTPVVLARFTERFETRRGVEASFTFGVGAGRPSGWIGWYQVALGGRLAIAGPAFLVGEVSLEQYDLVRLGIGVGVKL